MNASRLKAELESKLATALPLPKPRQDHEPGFSSGIPEIDSLIGTIPRGAITLVTGPLSSGKTTLMLSTISKAVNDDNNCALIDASDSFDVASAESAGFDLDRLLWVRCANNLQHALNATEIILQSAGFGLVVLDASLLSSRDRRGFPDSCWFRFRRAIENTPTGLLVLGPVDMSISCAAMSLELERGKPRWAGPDGAPAIASPLLGIDFTVKRRKPFPAKQSALVSSSLPYDIQG